MSAGQRDATWDRQLREAAESDATYHDFHSFSLRHGQQPTLLMRYYM